MRKLKKFGIVMVAVFALTAVVASSAQAGRFTTSAVGAFTGINNSPQEFNTNGTTGGAINRVTCNVATANGKANELETSELTATVTYNSCSAFLGITATVSAASYLFTAGVTTSNDLVTVDVENAITITIGSGVNACHVTVPIQGDHYVDVQNNPNSNNTLTFSSTVNDINSVGTGTVCGNNHVNGSYAGMFTIASAATLRFDTNP